MTEWQADGPITWMFTALRPSSAGSKAVPSDMTLTKVLRNTGLADNF